MAWNRGAAQNHPLYSTWREMRRRCENPKRKDYKNYGAKGVRVCDRWRESFWNFAADMGPKPSPELSLDRIDFNGNYAPDNCRWATMSEQLANRREGARGFHKKAVVVAGEQYPSLPDACKDYGISFQTVRNRVYRGWTLERAMTHPLVPRGQKTI